MTVRELTPFEKNHLINFGFNPDKIDEYGEMPVDYITGFTKFLSQYFVVNQNVLIPRVETEELVERIVEKYKDRKKVSFLEVGTGSGALGISIFNKLNELGLEINCVLSDLSKEALVVTKQNINKLIDSNKQNLVSLVESDLLSNIDDLSFDFCTANLPYIPSSRIKNLDSSVKDFEPILALDGGEDGLDLIKKLVSELEEKSFFGDLFLEVDDTHDKDKMNIFGDKLKDVWLDSNGKNRFAWLMF
jgi:release factor glutamine methyltransferase